MKKSGIIIIIVLFIAACGISFFAGDYMSDKEHREAQEQLCSRNISTAIDALENKGLSVEKPYILSLIWVAYELCDDIRIAADLNDLWITLACTDTYDGQDEALSQHLKDLLNRYNESVAADDDR